MKHSQQIVSRIQELLDVETPPINGGVLTWNSSESKYKHSLLSDYLLKSDNLNGLSDKATSRSNLDVLSSSQVNTLVNNLSSSLGSMAYESTSNYYTSSSVDGLLNSLSTYATNRSNHTGTQSTDTLINGITSKVFTTIERDKLAGITTGATANEEDDFLLDRSNHTGTQTLSTISDIGTIASQNSDNANITGGSLSNISNFSISNTSAILGSFSSSASASALYLNAANNSGIVYQNAASNKFSTGTSANNLYFYNEQIGAFSMYILGANNRVGFGTTAPDNLVTISENVNFAGNALGVRNLNAGSAASARFALGNNNNTTLLIFDAMSSTFVSGNGSAIASASRVQANGAGGLSLVANPSGSTVRIYPGGVTTDTSALIISEYSIRYRSSAAGLMQISVNGDIAGQLNEFMYRTSSSSIPHTWYTGSTMASATATGTKAMTLDPSLGLIVTRKISAGIVPLTDAATIATDASAGNTFTVTLTDNRTLGNPTNSTNGQKITWVIKQDGTGSRVLSFGSAFAFGTDLTGVTLTTTPNKVDYITAIYSSVTSTWNVIGFAKGYT